MEGGERERERRGCVGIMEGIKNCHEGKDRIRKSGTTFGVPVLIAKFFMSQGLTRQDFL